MKTGGWPKVSPLPNIGDIIALPTVGHVRVTSDLKDWIDEHLSA